MPSKDKCTDYIAAQGGVVGSQESRTLDPQNERKHPRSSSAQGTRVGEPFSTPNWWIKWNMDDK